MWQFALKRTAGLLPVLLVAVLLTFIAIQFVPGDPVQIMLSDHSGNVEMEKRLRAAYGLDKPLYEQFWSYLKHIGRGDFGYSYRYTNQTVYEIIRPSLLISPIIAVTALLLTLPPGIFLGVFAALRRNQWKDTAVIFGLVAGISIPNFALAAFLMYFFGVRLALVPVAGWGKPVNLVLPVLVLAVAPAAYLARLTRTYMLEVLQNDYVRTARAKGLRHRLVVYRHALAERAGAAFDDRRSDLRRPAFRHVRGGKSFQHSRSGQPGHRFDFCPGLSGGDDHRPFIHCLLQCDQPDRRPLIRGH